MSESSENNKSNPISLQLTQKQLQALEVIEWLISDDPRDFATGRTHVLACAFMAKALFSQGKWIPYWDHAGNRFPERQQLKDRISALLRDYEDIEIHWNETHFRIVNKNE